MDWELLIPSSAAQYLTPSKDTSDLGNVEWMEQQRTLMMGTTLVTNPIARLAVQSEIVDRLRKMGGKAAVDQVISDPDVVELVGDLPFD